MLNKKRALSLLLVLTSANLVSAASAAVSSADITNYLGKTKVDGLLQNQTSVVVECNNALVKDLQISNVADYFDCQTIVGHNFLTNALSMPIGPKSICSTVANRQALIMNLVSNSEFKAAVDALLLEAKAEEQVVVNLFEPQFRGETCPEEKQLALLKAQNYPAYVINKYFHTDATGKMVMTAYQTSMLAISLAVTAYLAKMNYDIYKNLKIVNNKLVFLNAYYLAINGYLGYLVGKDYLNAVKKRNKMHSLSKLITIAEQFEQLCVQNDSVLQFKTSDITNQDSLNLITELKKSRYAQDTAYVFMTPKVHSFLYEIYEKDNCFSEIFATIAELDACNAIATKILATQNGKNQFCFAQYLDQTKPEISTVDSWNVLVGEDKAVANSLHETKNVILSGVNAGGKTTYTRTILQNIVLAQTFGVAAANSFEFTPFDIISSYLNVSDDLIAGNSLFVSEVKRAQEIKAKIDEIAGTDLKYFFVVDELFTGTGADAGEKCACDFVSRIANSENARFFYPSHFDQLKHLGDKHPNCANYKVDTATKRADGSLKYPFTISKGASYDNIAMDIATQANLFN